MFPAIAGAKIRAQHARERDKEVIREADRAEAEAWSIRMEGYGGPAQPSPPIGDALNAGFRYLEVKCAGCSTHSTVDLTTLRRPRETPVWQLEHRMRCRPCSEMRGYPYKHGNLVRLRRTNITTRQDPGPWYPGDQRDRH